MALLSDGFHGRVEEKDVLRKHSVRLTGWSDGKGLLGVISNLLARHIHTIQLHRLLTSACRILAVTVGVAVVAYSYQSTFLDIEAPTAADE